MFLNAEQIYNLLVEKRITESQEKINFSFLDVSVDIKEKSAINRSANFDIANFEAYCYSITTKAYRLDADYLVFAYTLIEGNFRIKDVWLKKIWEITGNSERYPVKCQTKKDVIYNIRPISWDSSRAKFKSFNSRLEFVKALHQTLMQYPKTQTLYKNWLDKVA